MPLAPHKGGVALHVRATPKSSRDAFDGIYEDAAGKQAVRAYVRAVPEKGKANKALIKLLAKETGLAGSTMSVIAGAHNRNKVILIEGEPGELSVKLGSWLKELK